MPHQKVDPVKFCQACGTQLVRKRFDSGRLEDRGVFLRRCHCSKRCAATKSVVQRDTHRWRANREASKEVCDRCPATTDLHIHHRDRDVTNNAQENLQVLCRSCHLKLHWREDPTYRAEQEAALRGGRTGRRSNVGSEYLEGPLPPRYFTTGKTESRG